VGQDSIPTAMPSRLLSVFGSYDFFAKALPGMTFIVGIFPLLKVSSLPIPSLDNRFFIFIMVSVVVVLLGTLLGEVVHSIANHLEDVIAWAGKRGRDSITTLLTTVHLPPQPREPVTTKARDEFIEDQENGWSSNEGISAIAQGAYNRLYWWLSNRVRELEYMVWSHRSIFKERLTSPPADSFNKENLTDFVVNELEDEYPYDYDAIYTVITSLLSNSGCERAFKFEARYAFCRSMWFVLSFISIAYFIIITYPSQWWAPSALNYQPYLLKFFATNPKSVIGMISITLFITSVIFARAAGTYKRIYIEYLLSEFYVVRNIIDDT
jgi:hypothetical protein